MKKLAGADLKVCETPENAHLKLLRQPFEVDFFTMQGYFTMPYAYVMDSNLADDLWTIRLVSRS